MTSKFSPYLYGDRMNHISNHSLLKMIMCGKNLWTKETLCKGFQRTTINGSFSNCTEIMAGVPQGSILRPMLFIIFLNEILVFISNCKLCIYADGDTLCCIRKDLSVQKYNLEFNFLIMHKCFHKSHMVLNPGKCHLMLIGNESHDDKITLSWVELKTSNEEKLPGENLCVEGQTKK